LFLATAVLAGSFYLLARKFEAAPESGIARPTANAVGAPIAAARSASTPIKARAPSPAMAPDTNAKLRRIMNCHRLLATRSGIQRSICDDIVGDANAAQERCHDEMSKLNVELQEQETKSGICPEKLVAPSEYYAALRELALSGNLNAQRCFIQGYFGETEGVLLTQAQYEEHPVLAKQFIEAGFERGDWSLVEVLARTRIGFPEDSHLYNAWPHGFSTPESAENSYKMNYLLLLGDRHEQYEWD
jgi:hypothetical protein